MELTREQLDERVAILRRFKSLLEQKRQKFREYLKVLESQQGKIEIDDADSLVKHAELEQQIVNNISELQKVIEPFGIMAQDSLALAGDSLFCGDRETLTKMQNELDDLQEKVLVQNQKNRDLLKIHMEQIKNQLENLKKNNPYRNQRPVYSSAVPSTTTFAIEV